MKVKIFKSGNEAVINRWLIKNSDKKIMFITQSESKAYMHENSLTICIWYK